MLVRYERFVDKTFGDAADRYLLEFDGKCLTRQRYALEHVRQYIDDLPLIVDDEALAEYKRDRLEVAMVGTINKEIATVTAVLNKAARVWRWIPSAPLLQRVKGPVRQPYPFELAGADRLV